jgi:hypothetical protein
MTLDRGHSSHRYRNYSTSIFNLRYDILYLAVGYFPSPGSDITKLQVPGTLHITRGHYTMVEA